MNLINLIETYRIAITPGYDEWWYADLYYDAEYPLSQGYGLTIQEAVEEALKEWK